MGRFSPRPHNLAPYLAGDAALTSGILRGMTSMTGMIDQGQRTGIMRDEADSRTKMRDAQIASLEFNLKSALEDRAREWDMRPEAPVIAEGPSTQRPPQGTSSPNSVPNVMGMSGPPQSRQQTPTEQGQHVMDYDPNKRVPLETQGGATQGQGGAAGPPELDLPYIQGTDIPGDRFKRVDVPGGSMLAQPRSFHQKNEALQGAHQELYDDPMPGVSAALAQDVQPYKTATRSGLSNADWAWREDYKAGLKEQEGPDATDRNRAWERMDAAAGNYFALALERNGGDLDEAVAATQAAFPSAAFDANKGVTLVNNRRRRKDAIYRQLGMPPSDTASWAVDQIIDLGWGVNDVLDVLRSHPDTADQADEVETYLGGEENIRALLEEFFGG